MATNNTILFPHSSGGQKSKIGSTGLKSRCLQGWFPSKALRRGSFSSIFPASRAAFLRSSAGGPSCIFIAGTAASPAVSVLLTSRHHLLLCNQIFLCLPLLRTPVITFRAHLDNLGYSCYHKVLNLITPAKKVPFAT